MSDTPESKKSTFGENSTVTVGLAIVVAVLIGGYIIQDTKWKETVNNGLRDIERQLEVATTARYRRDHMVLWAERLRNSNPDINVPPVADVINDLGTP